MHELETLIKKGKIKVIDLPAKRDEIEKNQTLLLKDDLDNVEILLERKHFRGAYIHAFNALERVIDIMLIKKGYKTNDRYARKMAIKEILGVEFLGAYEDLFDRRKDGMYDTFGVISESDILILTEEMIPKLLEKLNIKLQEKK